MEPWYKVVTPRKEVREGRSFNPDEFAIALEQVVAGTAPEDYRDPAQFFARTYFTRALREHAGMVLRRLAGRTDNTAPVMTLITQFGGGKTHTLATLYHLAHAGKAAMFYPGVAQMVEKAGLDTVPSAKVAVFVGNAWDPQPDRETPWIDVARQLAGDAGVAALGKSALTTPPGTEALGRVFAAANAPVLLLFDEVLNYLNRHRSSAESFHAFIQNLTVAITGTTHGAAIIALPRSQVEMTDWDQEWQDKITKVVRRVAKDLIVTDEAETSEVLRRRLFQDLGSERFRRNVAKTFGDWCFDRRAQLPPEWTAVDSASTEAKAREFLQARFEACYPFHPATLSVFQRKWQTLTHYQQTRGTLAMLAQWISIAAQDAFRKARNEPLITLGSAPLSEPGFRSVVLGQLGESRLLPAIDTDIAGVQSHAQALDADTHGPLKDIHRRVGTVILFESSGGQTDKVAHLPELRFALGAPDVDTTSIDNAAIALEERSYFIRKVGTDGFRIGHLPTLRKVVSDRRASLDYESEIQPAMRKRVEDEFRRGASVPTVFFPHDGGDVADSPRLTLVVADPDQEWGDAGLRAKIAEYTQRRGQSPRLYPGALVWCFKKPGRELREKVETELAWKRVSRELADGTLGGEFESSDRADLHAKVRDADDGAKDEVWGDYRYAVLADSREKDGLRVIDLGAGHSSGSETLCGRVIAALRNEALLNESVGAGYIERNWPPALAQSGAWPLSSLRQSFLNGSLTRLIDPDSVLKSKIVEFVGRGDFGMASGQNAPGQFDRVWFDAMVPADEVSFDSDVFLLTKKAAQASRSAPTPPPPGENPPVPGPLPDIPGSPTPLPTPPAGMRTVVVRAELPAEAWNRMGTKVLTKLRSGATDLRIKVEFTANVPTNADALKADVEQAMQELNIPGLVTLSDTKADA
jgi:hypothetical protein